MAPPSEWVIIGAGGHGAAIAEVIDALGWRIRCFVDPGRVAERQRLGIDILPEIPEGHLAQGLPVALGVGHNFQRQQLADQLVTQGAKPENFPVLVHPSASVSGFAQLDYGTVLLQGAKVGSAATVGRFCVVATGAVAAHDAKMRDFSFISINAVLGASELGERTVESCSVAVGVPARVVRKRAVGEAYLG